MDVLLKRLFCALIEKHYTDDYLDSLKLINNQKRFLYS